MSNTPTTVTQGEIRINPNTWLEDIKRVGGPHQVGWILTSVINTLLRDVMPPLATPELIRIAKEHLQVPIIIDQPDIGSTKAYELQVYVPDDSTTHRFFFILVPYYPNGNIRKLSEVE